MFKLISKHPFNRVSVNDDYYLDYTTTKYINVYCKVNNIEKHVLCTGLTGYNDYVFKHIFNYYTGNVELELYINFERLYKLIKNGTILDIREIVKSYCRDKYIKENILSNIQEICTQDLDKELSTYYTEYNKKSPLLITFESKIELFNYQKENVSWIIKTEDKIRKGELFFNFDYEVKDKIRSIMKLDDNLFFDIYKGIFLLDKEPNEYKVTVKNISMNFKGGNLCDMMGLGKSLSIIFASIMSSKYNIKKEKDPFSYMEDGNNRYVKSRATLIFCPSQLCLQWKAEINKAMPGLNIIILDVFSTIEKNKYTYADLVNCDFVILSISFLNGKYKEHLKSIWRIDKEQYNKIIDYSIEEKSYQDFNKSPISLHNIYWERIVIDEYHQILYDNYICVFIKKLKSSFIWNVSGTPPVTNLDLFTKTINLITTEENNNLIKPLIDFFKTNLYRKNTKENVKDEVSLNNYTEEVIWLNFSKIEKCIYNHVKSHITSTNTSTYIHIMTSRLAELCCHPFSSDQYGFSEIKTFSTLEDIQKFLKSNIISMIENDKIRLVSSETELNTYERQLETSANVTMLNRIISRINESVTSLKASIDRNEHTIKYLEHLEENDVVDCLICLSIIENCCITKCGHKFCFECINGYMKSVRVGYPKCPTCRSELEDSDIYKVSEEKIIEKEEEEEEEELRNMVNMYGTKMAHIINYLKNKGNDEKIIIYSQFEIIIEKISKILTKENIENAMCIGSVARRNKATIKFNDKNSGMNILLLSSKYSSSGLDLTISEKIIMCDPIYGEKEDKRIIQEQIIGRINRINTDSKNNLKIVKFLIKDTVESENYYMFKE